MTSEIIIAKQIDFIDVSDWLAQISDAYGAHVRAGWEFIDKLRDGIDRFGGQNRHGVAELYELASQQIGLTVKTLQNYVSLSRSFPPERRVADLGINHYMAVQGLPDGKQDEMLDKAVANGLSIELLRYEVRKTRPDFIPDVRNESSSPSILPPQPYAAVAKEDEFYDDWPLVFGPAGNYRQSGETKRCEKCRRLWAADLPYCPYCHISPEVRAYEASKPMRLAAANHAISDDPNYDGDEWYTPSEYIEAARRVMGNIDLDPATCAEAQQVVKATTYYTKEDNSLRSDCHWCGNVWLNPPYSKTLIDRFTDKLIDSYDDGHISQAIIITNNSSDTVWFHKLLSRFPACFTRGRVRFWRPNLKTFDTRQGQTLFYLGENIDAFCREFSKLGVIVKALYEYRKS